MCHIAFLIFIVILKCLSFIVGPSVVKHFLPRMVVMWTDAFPGTSKESEQEHHKGDGFTWHVTLESRAGALCCKLLIWYSPYEL